MESTIEEIRQKALDNLLAKQNQVIEKAITAKIGLGWTLDGVKDRLHRNILQHDKTEIWTFDDEPFLEFKKTEVIPSPDGKMITLDQKYRRLF